MAIRTWSLGNGFVSIIAKTGLLPNYSVLSLRLFTVAVMRRPWYLGFLSNLTVIESRRLLELDRIVAFNLGRVVLTAKKSPRRT